MGTVPDWITIAFLSGAAIVIILTFTPLVSSRNRILFKLGWKHSTSSGGLATGRVLPVSLLVGIILASLSVGDGLHSMVETNTNRNLSDVDLVIEAPGFIDVGLIEEDGKRIMNIAPVILLEGGARSRKEASANIRVIGFDERLLDLGELESSTGKDIEGPPAGSGVILNRKASRDLSVDVGGWILVTLDPHDRSEDILLGMTDEGSVTMNLTVEDIVEDSGLGRYREDALDEIEPICFMDLERMRERLDLEGVNRFLIDTDEDPDHVKKRIEEDLTLEDAGFSVVEAGSAGGHLLRSDQFLFDEEDIDPDRTTTRTFTYFVDSLSSETDSISYSVVSGIEGINTQEGQPLEKGSVMINNWTAEMLDLEPGDDIQLEYRTADISGSLEEGNKSFKVAEIVNISGLFAERELLPPIEGVTGEESCSSWDPGFDIDLDSIRDADTEYWDSFKTTPKVFITIEDARKMWSSPWGDTTALWKEEERMDIVPSVSSIEISIIPVRENALSSSRALAIFPGMFLTFGLALIASTGLVLFAVLKDLTLRRAGEWGMMRSLGVNRRKVGLFGLYENLRPLILGSLLGVLLGVVISYVLNLSLSTIWTDTVEGSEVPLKLTISSLLVSISAGMIISTIVVALMIFNEVRKVPIANTRGEEPGLRGSTSKMIPAITGGVMLTAGILIMLFTLEGGGTFEVAGPFVIGSMLIGSGATLILTILVSITIDRTDTALIVSSSLSRRPGQTRIGMTFLALVLTLALSLSGMGSILESGLNEETESYGGGYDMVLETSSGIRDRLTDPEGMELLYLLTYGKEGGTCSNINAVYPPRLVGLPEDFMDNNGFDIKEPNNAENVWGKLKIVEGENIPILVDENTLRWIYFGDIGSIFEIEPEPGRTVNLEVIGILGPSVLTGTFVMAEEALKDLFPSASSYDLVLIRGETSEENKELLESVFSDLGPRISEVKDLARENLEYELSYLSLFRDFLIFGVVIAMGAMVMFNHNRSIRFRKEMVVYRSLGISRSRSGKYLLCENTVIILLSLSGAVVGSLVSIILTGSIIGDDVEWAGILLEMAPVLMALVFISAISSVISSYVATKDFDKQVPRGDA